MSDILTRCDVAVGCLLTGSAPESRFPNDPNGIGDQDICNEHPHILMGIALPPQAS